MAARSTPAPVAAGGHGEHLGARREPGALRVVGRALGGDDERGRELGVEQRARRRGRDRVASRSTRSGCVSTGPSASRTVRRGRSASAVPAPMTMACDSARRRWASARDAAPVIHCDEPSRAAMRPSRLIAVFTTVNARPRRRCSEVRRERAGGGVGADPDVDGDAEVAQLGDAPARDLRVGILERDDDAGDAGLGQRDDARPGAAVVRARFEGGVDGGAAGPVAGLAQRLDLGVGTAGRLRGALADDLAVAHDDARRPTGWARCAAGRSRPGPAPGP